MTTKPLTMMSLSARLDKVETLSDRIDSIETKIDALAEAGSGSNMEELLSAVALAVSRSVAETMSAKFEQFKSDLTDRERLMLSGLQTANRTAAKELADIRDRIDSTIIGL